MVGRGENDLEKKGEASGGPGTLQGLVDASE